MSSREKANGVFWQSHSMHQDGERIMLVFGLRRDGGEEEGRGGEEGAKRSKLRA